MWIEWKQNIAFRKGVGQVLAHVWEQLKEDELIDVVLG